MAKRQNAPKCKDCFFHKNMLCALALDSACPTFRPDSPQGLMPPRQPALLLRQDGAAAAGRAAAATAA